MTNSPRDTSFHPSPPSNVELQKSVNMNTTRPIPSFSEHDIQKMKYKIDLDKQVAEKRERNTLEWETKLERDKKYAKQQAVFGRHEHSTPIRKQDLEQILVQSSAPSPLVLKKPEQLSLHYQQSNISNRNNSSSSQRPTNENNLARSINSSSTHNDFSYSSYPDFQHPYGQNTYVHQIPSHLSSSTTTSHLVKGDAHDPFISFDPNKEPQQVFNIIPQQNLYEPWGRPGAGAPLVNQQTGQKFTRYAGSLEEKLDTVGPLSFYREQYNGNIHEQKRDLEIEQKRRQEERIERRFYTGQTAADWISKVEGTHYPLNFHLPSTKTTRQFTGTHDPYTAEESRTIHNDLSRQAEERTRVQQIARYENNIADLCHTEVQNSWWGRDGAGGLNTRNRRFNPQNSQAQRTTNALGQPISTDNKPSIPVRYYNGNYSYPTSQFVSKHTNFYQLSDTNNT